MTKNKPISRLCGTFLHFNVSNSRLTKNNYPIKASQILLIFTCFIDFYQSVEYIKQGRINGKINKEVTNEVSYLL